MTKKDNTFTEIQILEGIYSHLSTLDDLTKEISTISAWLTKIEARQNAPVEIIDTPIYRNKNNQITRDEAIYTGMIRADCSYKELKSQNETLAKIYGDLQLLKRRLEDVAEKQREQDKELTLVKKMISSVSSDNKAYFWMLAILLFAVMIIVALCITKVMNCVRVAYPI